MHEWLSGFYNHIEIGWDIYAMAILISLGIAVMSVLYTTTNAALANPVDSLGSE
jgi:putative ABC transport system permease protein